jgi:hypothetical protein
MIRPSRWLHWASLKKYVIGVSVVLGLCMAGQERQIPVTAQENEQTKPRCATGYTLGADEVCRADAADPAPHQSNAAAPGP